MSETPQWTVIVMDRSQFTVHTYTHRADGGWASRADSVTVSIWSSTISQCMRKHDTSLSPFNVYSPTEADRHRESASVLLRGLDLLRCKTTFTLLLLWIGPIINDLIWPFQNKGHHHLYLSCPLVPNLLSHKPNRREWSWSTVTTLHSNKTKHQPWPGSVSLSEFPFRQGSDSRHISPCHTPLSCLLCNLRPYY